MATSIKLSDLEFGREQLGSGVSATVYKGVWKSMKMTVAIKTMTQEVPTKELEIMCLVNHPNLVHFYGAVLQPPTFCIVTEYAEQGSLFEFLHQHEFDSDQNLKWTRQIAAGMKYLHFDVPNQVVIHGDLKSKNVLVAADNTAKICDFGSSKLRDQLPGMSTNMTTKVQGTPKWMAPEILDNKPISKRCDVYSYSIVVWELLTHKIPFENISDFIQLHKIVVLHKERPPLPATCTPVLANLLKKCWDPDPQLRPEFTDIVSNLEHLPQMLVDKGSQLQPAIEQPQTAHQKTSTLHLHLEKPRPVPRPRRPRPIPKGRETSTSTTPESVQASLLGLPPVPRPRSRSAQTKADAMPEPTPRSRSATTANISSDQANPIELRIPEIELTVEGEKYLKVEVEPKSPTQSDSPQLHPEAQPNWVIPSNEIELLDKELGKGASVCKGRWKPRQMTVAIKPLTQEVPEMELEIMSLVNHPNIVQFIGAVLFPPTYCIVTEYAEQGSLYDFLHQNVLDPDRNLMWARQIAAGMKYLHFDVPGNQVVIHGDLQSKNVLIAADSTAKLLQGKSLQTTTKIFGTMRWMAPEIMENKPVSKQCDVYSYGIVVWELLTHQTPFSDVNDFQIYNTVVVNKELPPLPATCEPTLAGLLRSCWNYDPQSRPEFTVIVHLMEQLLQMFTDSATQQPTSDRPIPQTRSGQLAIKLQPVPRPRSPQFGEKPEPTSQLETGSVSEAAVYVDFEAELPPRLGEMDHSETNDSEVYMYEELPLLEEPYEDFHPHQVLDAERAQVHEKTIPSEDMAIYEVGLYSVFATRDQFRPEALQEAHPSWAISRDEIEFLDEEIGRGSWGVVKKARFRGEVVAAKYLHEALQVEPNLLQAFKREMNIAANLRHPNLVLFLGATTEGELIILSELMDSNLRAVLAQEPLSQARIKSFAFDIARALNYLHSWKPHPLIHRDVSSANVLLECLGSDSWKAKVSDYGSLKASNLASTVGPGNPVYAAPEAFRPGPQSCKMDTYSFGILLIEMCTGEFPIPEERARLLRGIKWPEMHTLIEMCIPVNPEDRLTMLNIISALENLSRKLPTQQPQAQTHGDMRWFVPTMSRRDAVKILALDGRQGNFLVRLSSSGDCKYSLSVCHQGKVYHYRISENQSQECYIEDNYQFQTLEELIEFYKNTQTGGLLTTLCEYPPKRTLPSYTDVLNDQEWKIPKSELTFGTEIARGQCGHVAAGTCKGSKVAIRVTKQEAMDETGLQFLGDAVNILKEFQHDNLVKLFGICAQEGPLLIVTELMAKGPLDKYLQRHPELLQRREVLLWMAINICSAMMFLDGRKIIHGDLAARNCLVGERNVVKVADYSLALYTSPRKPSRTVVSVRWAAPELIARTVTFTTKSDVWSFGILLWEIWTGGQLPYPSMSNKEVKDKLPGGYRLEKPDNCPQELYELMHKCWKLNSDQRPSFTSIDTELATMDVYENIPEDDEEMEDAYDTAPSPTGSAQPIHMRTTAFSSGVGVYVSKFWPFKRSHSGNTNK